jgi:hypothetical protein
MPAFADAGQTYKDFKTEILSLYPSAGTDCTFSIQDLDLLIGEQAQVGIISTNSIADYYRQFLLILHYLISKNRLSSIDQLQNFMQGFCPELAQCVMQRLELCLLTHLPEDPYTISKVYNAANFIIGRPAGSAFTTTVQGQPVGSTSHRHTGHHPCQHTEPHKHTQHHHHHKTCMCHPQHSQAQIQQPSK